MIMYILDTKCLLQDNKKGGINMIDININQDELRELAREALQQKLDEIKDDVFFMDSKQLQKFVCMSWNSIVTHLLSDEQFPAIRLGNRWLFPRKEVEAYMQKFYEAVRDDGGDIYKYVRK